MDKYNRFFLLSLAITLFLLGLLALGSHLDLTISQWFYAKDAFASTPFFDFFYNYGFVPAWVLSTVAFVLFIVSFKRSSLIPWRAACLYLVLTYAIGSGLIVHVLLKDHWGRPRPKQIEQFGGSTHFVPFYQPNFGQPYKSFPCGHCSTGFYFFSVMFLGWHYKKRWLFWIGLILALSLGVLLSLTRIAQGGHFFSDTVVSALIMWWVCLAGICFLPKQRRFFTPENTETSVIPAKVSLLRSFIINPILTPRYTIGLTAFRFTRGYPLSPLPRSLRNRGSD